MNRKVKMPSNALNYTLFALQIKLIIFKSHIANLKLAFYRELEENKGFFITGMLFKLKFTSNFKMY